MIYVILAILGALLYYDSLSSTINGGFADRGPFHLLFIGFIVVLGYSCFRLWNKYKTIHVNRLTVYILFLLSVIVINDILKGNSLLSDLRVMYSGAWIVIIVAMENIFAHLNNKKAQHFLIGMTLLFLFSVYNAYTTLNYMMNERDRIVIPCIYISLMFLPWILVTANRFYIKPTLILILMGIVALSAKRGAILAMVAAFLVYYYKKSRLEKGRIAIGKIVGIGFVSFAVLMIIDSYMGGSIASRFTSDSLADASGRGDSNDAVIYAVLNYATFSDVMFGFSDETRQITDFLGHNDWFSFLVTDGLVGTFFFGMFMYRVFKDSLLCRNKEFAPAYASLFVMMFLQSIYSTTINPTIHPIFAMMFIGYAEGQIRKLEKI